MRVDISRGRARETKWRSHVGEINKQACLSRLCSLARERSKKDPRLQRANCNVMQRRAFSGPYSCAIRIVVRL